MSDGYVAVTDEQIKTLFKRWNPDQIATFIYTARITDKPIEEVILDWEQIQEQVKKALIGQRGKYRG
jgi:hypothetical protein